MNAPKETLDLNEAFDQRLERAIREVCREKGFDNPQINIFNDGLREEGYEPSLVQADVTLAPNLPNLGLNIHSDGSASLEIQSKYMSDFFDKDNVDTNEMHQYITFLAFCNDLATKVGIQCKLVFTASEEGNPHTWRTQNKEILDKNGDVKDVEYVRHVVDTVFNGINSRKSGS